MLITYIPQISLLKNVFYQIAHYLQNIAAVAGNIATGVLDGKVQVRSEHDMLGKSTQEMLRYLGSLATIATRIASGDCGEQYDAV